MQKLILYWEKIFFFLFLKIWKNPRHITRNILGDFFCIPHKLWKNILLILRNVTFTFISIKTYLISHAAHYTKHTKLFSVLLEDSIFGTKTKIAARDKARHLALLLKHSSFFLSFLFLKAWIYVIRKCTRTLISTYIY